MAVIGLRRTGGSWRRAAPGPSDRALDRLAGRAAVALRLIAAMGFAVAAPLAAAPGTGWWLPSVIGALLAWSAAFAWLVRRDGLTGPLAVADLAVITAIVITQRHVVPAALTADGTTWMLPLASTSVYILQLALRPVLGLPAAAVVLAGYVLSVPRPGNAWFLGLQAVITAVLVSLLRRGGRRADADIAAGLRAGQDLRAQEARRADEREQHRQVHDTILSTLTMVAAGAFAGRSPVLSGQAARDLAVLRGLPDAPALAEGGSTDLLACLEQVAERAAPLRVRVAGGPAVVPALAAEQIAASAAEALRNVAQHAGTSEAEVTVRAGADGVTVEIRDGGRGFDTGAVPPSRRGLRESVAGRMAAAGGTGSVRSAPGAGTTVILRWPA
jgi:anti-sigma regulatory factor (Ser/Thr protein kinase)